MPCRACKAGACRLAWPAHSARRHGGGRGADAVAEHSRGLAVSFIRPEAQAVLARFGLPVALGVGGPARTTTVRASENGPSAPEKMGNISSGAHRGCPTIGRSLPSRAPGRESAGRCRRRARQSTALCRAKRHVGARGEGPIVASPPFLEKHLRLRAVVGIDQPSRCLAGSSRSARTTHEPTGTRRELCQIRSSKRTRANRSAIIP